MTEPYEIVERIMSFKMKFARIEVHVSTAEVIAMLANEYQTTPRAFLEAQVVDWLHEAARQEAYVNAFTELAKRVGIGHGGENP